MLHFFYDSLDTLKKVKKPTWKEVRVFTWQVFIVVLVSAFIFFILDTLRGNLYQQIFQVFGTPKSSVVAPSWNIEIPAVAPTQEIKLSVPWDWGDVEVVPSDEIPAQELPAEPVVDAEAAVEVQWEEVVPTPEA